jgi:3-dehydroquinate synthase
MNDTPLILAGFMGTGKSTVGRLCARQLGFDFVDADAEIERREGLRIPHIFETHGEAYFREREAALVAELVQRQRVVIATGGGMIVDDASRATLLAAGVCVNLAASPEAIAQRIGEDAAARRPMLRGGELRERIAHLLKERAPKYAQLHYLVDTTHLTMHEVAERVLAIHAAEQARIPVAASASYDIVLGDGVLDQLGFMLAGKGWTPPFAIVSDSIVSSYLGGRVLLALKRAGIDAFIHTMPPGEASKTLASVEAMYRKFSVRGMERTSPVIALGGGVVGDAAGFAAATYLRGVPFVQVPTSLLAMADSAIGGKTGVDTPFGKNLVGAFKQPDLVVIDTSALFSLPIRELRCGMAEIIKAALLTGGEPYARLREAIARKPMAQAHSYESGEDGWVTGDLVNALVDAILLKRAVVEEDPFEKGRRALLNLGHTFGHGIEAWSQFRLKHGEAVSLGMACALRLSRQMAFCNDALVEDGIAMLRGVGLPTSLAEASTYLDGLAFDADAIWNYMMSDKKKRAGKLRFVLIRAPGDAFVCDEVSEVTARVALARLSSDS